MAERKRTPGPWKYRRTHLASNDVWYVITDAQGYGPIVEVGGQDESGQIAEAKYLITDPHEIEGNALHIVRACNSFDALLAAAKALVGRIEDGTLVRDITKDASPDWSIRMLKFVQELQQAQAAIAAAEEGNE